MQVIIANYKPVHVHAVQYSQQREESPGEAQQTNQCGNAIPWFSKEMHGEGRQQRSLKCGCKCEQKIDKAARKQLFDEFWAVDWNRKRDFVIANTSINPTSRKTDGESSRRKLTVSYYLPVGQSRVQVCKKFFFNHARRWHDVCPLDFDEAISD